MASCLLFLLATLLVAFHVGKADDKEDVLLTGVNTYRASISIVPLRNNDNAECLADEIAEQLEDGPCPNSTGPATVPATEAQFPNYPQLLARCHLNTSTTRDGVILPVCVPGLQLDIVLSSFTKSQYAKYLNDSQYVGTGIGSEDDWMVMILTTNTPLGSFQKASGSVVGGRLPLTLAALLPVFLYRV